MPEQTSNYAVDGKRVDPYRGFRYTVKTIDGVRLAGFRTVSGLRSETEITEYREGIDGGRVLKLPGITNYDNIVLERGISADESLMVWRNQVFEANKDPELAPDDVFRKDLIITLHNRQGQEVKKWQVYDAWPAIYEVDTLDSGSSDVIIERVELANEGHKLLTIAA